MVISIGEQLRISNNSRRPVRAKFRARAMVKHLVGLYALNEVP